MILVDAVDGPTLVGPIAEGETPEQAVTRMEKWFDRLAHEYSFKLYDEPKISDKGDQLFPVIIGTVWAK